VLLVNLGQRVLSPFRWYCGFAHKDVAAGLHTSQDARFYSISTKLAKSFSNKGKTLVIQFSVKHQQNIDCGGGYL